MLDRQLEQFDAVDRLLAMTLGLESYGRRIEALLEIPRTDGTKLEGGALLDLFLGMVAVRRVLHANLTGLTEQEQQPPGRASSGAAVPREILR